MRSGTCGSRMAWTCAAPRGRVRPGAAAVLAAGVRGGAGWAGSDPAAVFVTRRRAAGDVWIWMTTVRCPWPHAPRPWPGCRGSRPSTPRRNCGGRGYASGGVAALSASVLAQGLRCVLNVEPGQCGRQLGLPAARIPGRPRCAPLPTRLARGCASGCGTASSMIKIVHVSPRVPDQIWPYQLVAIFCLVTVLRPGGFNRGYGTSLLKQSAVSPGGDVLQGVKIGRGLARGCRRSPGAGIAREIV